MTADIRFVTDDPETMYIEGTARFLGKIISTNAEITSVGPVAGFSFSDRASTFPIGATRFVWYCSNKTARLWSDVDLMTVEKNEANQATVTINGAVKAERIYVGASNVQTEIESLKKMAAKLCANVNAICRHLGMPEQSCVDGLETIANVRIPGKALAEQVLPKNVPRIPPIRRPR